MIKFVKNLFNSLFLLIVLITEITIYYMITDTTDFLFLKLIYAILLAITVFASFTIYFLVVDKIRGRI